MWDRRKSWIGMCGQKEGTYVVAEYGKSQFGGHPVWGY